MNTIAVVYRRAPGIDAIDQYSTRLTSALNTRRVAATYHPSGLQTLGSDPAVTDVLLQYNPFRWGRSGFAPKLISDLRAQSHRRRTLTLMVHEAWIEIGGPQSAIIGGWQRVQLRALVRLADRVMTSSEAIARDLRAVRPVHAPPGSTIEPVPSDHSSARAALGLEDRFVVTIFGRGNPSRALGYAEQAIASVSRTLGPDRLKVLNLGAGAPAIRVPIGVEQIVPGEQVEAELSRHLWASDLVLLPFSDGLTTRRTTLMASLAHGRPVLGLGGPRTDSVLRGDDAPVCLTPLGDIDGFARCAVRLSEDPEARDSLGRAGLSLYRSTFDWPVLADTVAEMLSPTQARPPAPPASASNE